MKLFPTEFLDHCKKNGKGTHNIPSEVKTDLEKWFSKKKGLYAQVVMI